MTTDSDVPDLHFATPDCPRCDKPVEGDGSGWWCDDPCNLEWRSDGTHGAAQR
jgi:hypothetical protein